MARYSIQLQEDAGVVGSSSGGMKKGVDLSNLYLDHVCLNDRIPNLFYIGL